MVEELETEGRGGLGGQASQLIAVSLYTACSHSSPQSLCPSSSPAERRGGTRQVGGALYVPALC